MVADTYTTVVQSTYIINWQEISALTEWFRPAQAVFSSLRSQGPSSF